MDHESRMMSMASQAVVHSIAEDRSMTQEEGEALRKAYLMLIEQPVWKPLLLQSALEIKRGLNLSDFPTNQQNYQIQVNLDGNLLEFDQQIITIGRKTPGCELVLSPQNNAASRLHAVVYILPENILVIDLGSFIGIKTKLRSDQAKPVQHSLPNERRPLIFGRNEIFVLEFGLQQIVFSPKICMICMERPRGYQGECGHFAMCMFCRTEQVRRAELNCPICRDPDNNAGGRHVNHIATFAAQD